MYTLQEEPFTQHTRTIAARFDDNREETRIRILDETEKRHRINTS